MPLPRRILALAVLLAVGTLAVRADDVRGRDAEPDYGRVFHQTRVGRLDITIASADWQAVLDDMQSMAGPRGAQGGAGGPGGGVVIGPGPGGGQGPGGGAGPAFPQPAIAACAGLLEGNACSFGTPAISGRCVQTGNNGPLACLALPAGGPAPPMGGGGAAFGRDDVEIFPRTPAYVPADLAFEGERFRRVGFRLKGNSSLANTWRSGSDKLPFRLNIDGVEERFPESRDQTFFGFPNLSFSNNALDQSYLRQKVVTDLFRQAGLPAVQTSFMRVFLDRGAGSSYLGLYTMTEVPDGPFLRATFGSDDGNLYKPSGTGGRWTTFLQGSFPKRTNEAEADWTDIEDAIAALQASRADAAAWRRRLEARFDVSVFLRWLALNTMIGNFDAYGGLSAHNYYLYGSPRHRDRLFWIPWDHDLSLSGGGFGPTQQTIDLFHAGINAAWPLIRFLLDDPVYRAAYRGHVESLLGTVFDPARVGATLRSEQARIAPYVIGSEGELPGRTFVTAAQFDAAVFGPNGLLVYIEGRAAAIRRALATAP